MTCTSSTRFICCFLILPPLLLLRTYDSFADRWSNKIFCHGFHHRPHAKAHITANPARHIPLEPRPVISQRSSCIQPLQLACTQDAGKYTEDFLRNRQNSRLNAQQSPFPPRVGLFAPVTTSQVCVCMATGTNEEGGDCPKEDKSLLRRVWSGTIGRLWKAVMTVLKLVIVKPLLYLKSVITGRTGTDADVSEDEETFITRIDNLATDEEAVAKSTSYPPAAAELAISVDETKERNGSSLIDSEVVLASSPREGPTVTVEDDERSIETAVGEIKTKVGTAAVLQETQTAFVKEPDTGTLSKEPEAEAVNEPETEVQKEQESVTVKEPEIEAEIEAAKEPETEAEKEQEIEVAKEPETEAVKEPETKSVKELETEPLTKEPETAMLVQEPETATLAKEAETAKLVKEPKTEAQKEQETETVKEPEMEEAKEPETEAQKEQEIEVAKEPETEAIKEPETKRVKELEAEPLMKEPETPMLVQEPETATLVKELETEPLVKEPETAKLVQEPETATLVKEPETATLVHEPETVTVKKPETVTAKKPETVTAKKPETATLVQEPETVTVVKEPETATLVQEPETATQEPETASLVKEAKTFAEEILEETGAQARPKGERWAVSSPDVDLTGRWKIIVTDSFKKEYETYLRNLGQPMLVRSISLSIIGMTREETKQTNHGRDLWIKGRNTRGVWERTLHASGSDFDVHVEEFEDFEHRTVPIVTADEEKLDAQAWWEKEGTVHVSWLKGGKKYGGGDFYSRRFLEDDGNVLVCHSVFHPWDASREKATITWRFERDDSADD